MASRPPDSRPAHSNPDCSVIICAMRGLVEIAEVVAVVVREKDFGKALGLIASAALQGTSSRNAMLALMNDEKGCLELRHGVGEEWDQAGFEKFVEVNVASAEGIVGFVAATGNSFVTGNVQAEPRYRKLFESTVSEIAIPVRDQDGRIRAVLNVESDRENDYDEGDKLYCEVLANLLELVLEREEQRLREQALVLVGSALDNAEGEEQLLDLVIRVAGEVLQFQACSIFIRDPSEEVFTLRASTGRLKEMRGRIHYKAGEGCTGWVCENAQPIRLDQPQDDPRWRGRFLEFPASEIAGFLAVPVVFRNHCTGVIRVIRKRSEHAFLDNRFTDSDQRILQAIGEQLATGLETIRSIEKLRTGERMAAWGELSAKSSHMIGNRVFALKGDVNELRHLVSTGQSDAEELGPIIESLDANVVRVEEILQDFRDFVTATQIRLEPTDINALVSETVSEVIPRRAGIKLQLNLSDEIPLIQSDAKRIRRALSELIENSIVWMNEGELRISTRMAEPSLVRQLKLRPNLQYVAIEVEDSGPGVESNIKNKIFQPFFSGRVKGMGLGLSIVKGIAEAHGGTVIEIGAEGEGAKFVVLLPSPDRPNEGK